MNKKAKIDYIKTILSIGRPSVGGWMHIPSPEIAEILGNSKFHWVALDLEHGSIGIPNLPSIFRALVLNDTLPFVRIAGNYPSQAVRAMEQGAAGVIVPNIESAEDVEKIYSSINYPPRGNRGVGYNRGNCYGVEFNNDLDDNPFLVGMIETQDGVNNIDAILDCNKLDAILIGPYDLSASFNMTGQFDNHFFKEIVKQVKDTCIHRKIPVGLHVVQPNPHELLARIDEGYTFIPYGGDVTMLSSCISNVNKDL